MQNLEARKMCVRDQIKHWNMEISQNEKQEKENTCCVRKGMNKCGTGFTKV